MEKALGTKYIWNDNIQEMSNLNADALSNSKFIYEVIRIIDGIPLFAERHINRLYRSAALIKINLNIKYETILKRLNLLITANEFQAGNIKLVIQACEGRGLDETFYAYFIPYYYPTPKEYQTGVKVISVKAIRANPNAKQANSNLRKSINMKLQEAEAFEALLVNSEGYITEGSRSNVFYLRDKILFCSDPGTILPGVTRDIIISQAQNSGLTIREENIRKKDLPTINAVFLSGTSPKVLPVNKIDQYSYKSADNLVVKQIMREYDQVIDAYIKDNKYIV